MNPSNFDVAFSAKLDSTLYRCFGEKNLLPMLCGLTPDTACETLVLSSLYRPADLLNGFAAVDLLGKGTTGESWLVRLGDISFPWIFCERSAGSIMDLCLALTAVDCGRILFIGEATSLRPELDCGTVLVPNKAISGTGATRYLCEEMTEDSAFLTERRTPPKGILWLSKAAIRSNVSLKTCTVYSTDTLLGAMLHRHDLEKLDAEALDFCSSAFARCMILTQTTGASLLVVTRQTDEQGRLHDADQATLSNAAETVRNLLTNLL